MSRAPDPREDRMALARSGFSRHIHTVRKRAIKRAFGAGKMLADTTRTLFNPAPR